MVPWVRGIVVKKHVGCDDITVSPFGFWKQARIGTVQASFYSWLACGLKVTLAVRAHIRRVSTV
jgi:hypothetical protein